MTVAERTSPNFLARGWRNVREAGPRRLALTALLLIAALLLARFSWNLPWVDAQGASVPTLVTGEAERALYDYRVFRFAPSVGQDDRVLMVVYDDQTLIAARKPPFTEYLDDRCATLVDPSSHEELCAALWSVLLRGRNDYGRLSSGVERAKRFTWSRAATDHIRLYRQLPARGGQRPSAPPKRVRALG